MDNGKNILRNKARELYNQGYKLIAIAKKLNISDGTIRSWKNRYKWDSNKNATLQKKENKKCNVAKEKNIIKKNNEESIIEEVKEIMNNNKLTDRQRLFCIYYPKCFNATKAYQKAYKCSYNVANAEGYKLLVNPRIRAEIERLKRNKMNRAMLSPDDIFQKYMDIAFSNMTDYSTFGSKTIIMRDKKTGKPMLNDKGKEIKFKINYVDLNDSSEVDGSLISEIKEGKDGVSIKLHDSMKALDWLTKHMDMATEEQRLRMDKMRVDIEKAKNENLDDDIEYTVEGEIDEDQEED